MDLEKIALEFLVEQKLLKQAWKPPSTKEECGYGWSPGEWEEKIEEYQNDIKYNDALIFAIKNLLTRVIKDSCS